MSTLTVQLLGGFAVFVDGQEIGEECWRSQNSKGLIAYLAANRTVDRGDLMTAFWPEFDRMRARANMCSTVRYARTAFKISGIDDEVIRYEGNHYAFAPNVECRVDAAQFCDHVQRARQAPTLLHAVRHYRAALRLYRGEYMLGFGYDWAVWPREEAKAQYIEVLERLAAINQRCGFHDAAIGYCERILRVNRCWEEAHCILMESEAALGHRGRAMEQYRLMRDLLRTGLGVNPSGRTTAIYERLRER